MCFLRRPETRLFAALYADEHFFTTTQKTTSIVKKARLLIRSVAMDVLLLRALAPAIMFTESLPSNGSIRQNMLY
jgi:hypothetical protein